MAAAIARPTANRALGAVRLELDAGPQVPAAAFLCDDGPVLFGEAAERHGRVRPDRLVREFVDRVGDSVPVVAGTRRIAAEDLYARAVHWVVDRAIRRMEREPASIAVATPTTWGGGTADLVRQAFADRGLHRVGLTDGAAAAAIHHAPDADADREIIVYDLGALRLDVSAVAVRGGVASRLATERVERRGGRWFDDAVVRHVITEADGAFGDFDSSDPGAGAALAALRRGCIEAKESLSQTDEVSISVRVPSGGCDVRLSRSTFEGLVGHRTASTGEAVLRALDLLEIGREDAATVLLVGGSSRIPLIARQLGEQLGREVVVASDPDGAIARGAAITAARRLDAETEHTAIATTASEEVDDRLRVRAPWLRRPRSLESITARRSANRSGQESGARLGSVGASQVSDRREATG